MAHAHAGARGWRLGNCPQATHCQIGKQALVKRSDRSRRSQQKTMPRLTGPGIRLWPKTIQDTPSNSSKIPCTEHCAGRLGTQFVGGHPIYDPKASRPQAASPPPHDASPSTPTCTYDSNPSARVMHKGRLQYHLQWHLQCHPQVPPPVPLPAPPSPCWELTPGPSAELHPLLAGSYISAGCESARPPRAAATPTRGRR